MHIFIDESGTFAFPPEGEVSPSVVGALIVPECSILQLFRKYERVRKRLPKENGEVKGRRLNEQQIDEVVTWLRRNQCIFEPMVIEMGRESVVDIAARQNMTANALTDSLTDQHHPNVIRRAHELKSQLETMPLPLYVQAAVTFELLARIIREQPAYWMQRQPKEILNYYWMVDGKSIQGITTAEEWWDVTKAGFLQSKLAYSPMIVIEGYDLSAFENKFKMKMPEYLRDSLFPNHEEGYDLKRILEENFIFSSAPEYGLELVDIVTNATRRALKGHLEEKGFRQIPQLMVSRREHSLTMVSLSKTADAEILPYRDIVLKAFRRGGRMMAV